MLFYMAQRSGPINDELVPWRETSTITDKDGDVDLTGGWFDGVYFHFYYNITGSTLCTFTVKKYRQLLIIRI